VWLCVLNFINCEQLDIVGNSNNIKLVKRANYQIIESINAKAIYLKNYNKLHPIQQSHIHKKYAIPNPPTRLITEHYATHHRTERTKQLNKLYEPA